MKIPYFSIFSIKKLGGCIVSDTHLLGTVRIWACGLLSFSVCLRKRKEEIVNGICENLMLRENIKWMEVLLYTQVI